MSQTFSQAAYKIRNEVKKDSGRGRGCLKDQASRYRPAENN